MSLIQSYLSGPVPTAIGLTLLHSLWQGTVVGLIAYFILKSRGKGSAQFRYTVSILSLTGILFCSVISFILIYQPVQAQQSMIPAAWNLPLIKTPDMETFTSYTTEEGSGIFHLRLVRLLPWLSMIWITGVLFFSLRLAGGLFILGLYRSRNVYPVPEEWNQRFSRLLENAGIRRRIGFLISAKVNVPMVSGFLKPIILVPAGIISLLPVEQLEAILAHEIAHIRRCDFLLNILQTLTEAVFFYHPVVWALSGYTRRERENCCDDYAVLVCGKLSVYARALASLSEYRMKLPLPAVALNGKKSEIIYRVERLINPEKMKNNAKERFVAGILILGTVLILTFSTGAGQPVKIDLRTFEKETPAKQAESTKPVSSEVPEPEVQKVAGPEAAESLESVPYTNAVAETETAGLTEPAEISESAGISEPAEISESAELTEPAGISEPAEISESAGTSEPAGISEAAEISEALIPDRDSLNRMDRMDVKDNVVIREFVMKDGTRKKMKYVIRRGSVEELYVDGKEIPKSDFGKYQQEIDRTLSDLGQMEMDLKNSQQELADLDLDQMQEEIKAELDRFREEEWPKIKEELENMNHEQFEMQMDKEKVQKEIQQAMENMQIDKEKMKMEMERAKKELQEHIENFDKGDYELSEEDLRNLEFAMQEAMESLENINQEELHANLEKQMQAMQEMDFEKMKKELERSMKEFDVQKMEQEFKRSIQELEKEKSHVDKERQHIDEMVRELEKLELKK